MSALLDRSLRVSAVIQTQGQKPCANRRKHLARRAQNDMPSKYSLEFRPRLATRAVQPRGGVLLAADGIARDKFAREH